MINSITTGPSQPPEVNRSRIALKQTGKIFTINFAIYRMLTVIILPTQQLISAPFISVEPY